MKDIEDLLRDAYRDAAQTVPPDPALNLDFRPGPESGQDRHPLSRRTRMMIPLAAAASIAVIAVLSTVIIPRALSGTGPNGQSGGPAASSPEYFVATTAGPNQLSVNRSSTGAFVTAIHLPSQDMYVSAVAAWGNQAFVTAISRPQACTTWLYQFRLSVRGHPSALARLAVLRGRLVVNLSVSGNGQKLAYYSARCSAAHGSASRDFLGVMDMTTKQTRQWAIAEQGSESLSLSANGQLLAYSFGSTSAVASSVMLLPTNASSGPAVERSRIVVRAARFGRSAAIGSDVLAPDGRTVYFVISSTGTARAWKPVWQLRAADLAGGPSRLLGSFAGFPSAIAADPAVRHVLIMYEPPSSGPSPSPSPTGRSGNPSPSPSPTGRSGNPSPSPSPTGRSGNPSPSPSPTGRSGNPSPSPSPRRPQQPTPSPSATRSPQTATMRVLQMRVPQMRLLATLRAVLEANSQLTRSPSPRRSQSPTPSPSPTPTPSPTPGPQLSLLVRINIPAGQVTYLRALPADVLSVTW